MRDEPSFRDLIDRVRAGDARAETELVRHYEPIIQMVIRRRLTDSHLRRILDSLDICQSVFLNFFPRAALGQYELDTEEQLLKLLVTIALNRLRYYYRTYPAPDTPLSEGLEPVDPQPSPSEVATLQELVQKVRSSLSAEERQIMDLRAAGQSWAESAAQIGGSADALRMHYGRAIATVLSELGLQNQSG
jgi:RNA polymerase sigma-70 factor (ECF subfamily)